jgi:hypothetical protein
VYENCIVLNGRDFIDSDNDGHGIGIATYKINTTLQTIEANTFTDSTGTIITAAFVSQIELYNVSALENITVEEVEN